jgi:hypothetical protein
VSDGDSVIRTERAIVVVLDHRHSPAELEAFFRSYGEAGTAPTDWDEDDLAREFEEYFHTYTHARRVEDYLDRDGRVLLVIERREPARIGSGPR